MKIAFTLLGCTLLLACPFGYSQATPAPAAAPGASEPLVAEPAADSHSASAQTVSVSQVRIVRLSQVTGQVDLDRKTGKKFDAAFINLPVVAGAALRTREGLAEVEFEDNSSLRLVPESQVEFPSLGRSASGATLTTVRLTRGSLYVSLANSKNSGDFTLDVSNQTISLAPSTHLRIDLHDSWAKMVVFQGSANLSGPTGSMAVTKKKAVRFDTGSAFAPQLTQAGEASVYDAWDKTAVDYHKVRTNALLGGSVASPYSYGMNDLNYYGSFSDVGGCGSMWRPHLASAAFDPYSSGVWSWYPGQGYSWVSLYPWGWAPFHSGSWDYCPAGGGWGWRPQGTWRGLQNHPVATSHSGVHGPVRPVPPLPPGQGQPTLVAVNLKALQPSQQGQDGKFVFRAGSAGLGVPRGVFGNLAKMSDHAETHGTATTYLSERQIQAGLMAPIRTGLAGPLGPALSSAASPGSAVHSGSASTSSSFAASHSISTSPVSSGSSLSPSSFRTATSSSSSASAATPAASSHK